MSEGPTICQNNYFIYTPLAAWSATAPVLALFGLSQEVVDERAQEVLAVGAQWFQALGDHLVRRGVAVGC